MGRIVRQQPPENGQNGHAMEYNEANGSAVNEKTTTTTTTDKPSSRFIGRVASIPLIKDSMSTAQSIANKTSIGRYALSTATSSYEYALNNPQLQVYYQQYIQPHADKANELGCRSLDAIESKVPLIKRPTSDIIPSYQTIKLRADSAIETVTHPAYLVIESVNRQLGKAVDRFEGAVDTYLPPTEVEKETGTQDNQIKRTYDVLNKVTRRVVARSTAQIPKSREEMARLAEDNATFQNVYEQLKIIQEALVQSVTVYKQAAEERLPTFVVARAQATIQYVSQVMGSVQTHIDKLNLAEMPAWTQQRLSTLLEATQHQVDLMRTELARKDISYVNKLKHVADHLQSQLMPLLESLSSQMLALKGKLQHELSQQEKIKTQ